MVYQFALLEPPREVVIYSYEGSSLLFETIKK